MLRLRCASLSMTTRTVCEVGGATFGLPSAMSSGRTELKSKEPPPYEFFVVRIACSEQVLVVGPNAIGKMLSTKPRQSAKSVVQIRELGERLGDFAAVRAGKTLNVFIVFLFEEEM